MNECYHLLLDYYEENKLFSDIDYKNTKYKIYSNYERNTRNYILKEFYSKCFLVVKVKN